MNLWKDRRVDSLHRVVLPREAFSLLGWTSDEVLEAEALPPPALRPTSSPAN